MGVTIYGIGGNNRSNGISAYIPGSRDGRLVGRYCSSSGPSVLSSGRVLYLRFATSQTITERGFKLRYYSIAGNQGVYA